MGRHGMPGAAEGGWKVTGVPVPCTLVWSHRSHPPTPPTEAPPAEAEGGQSRPAEASGYGISSAPPAASVEAIMRRLSLLESRVGAQLHQIEAGMCASGGCSSGGGSAPVSPLRSAAQGDPWAVHAQHGLAGSWSPPVGARSHSRAAQAAAVAAAAVWGSTNGTDGSEASLAAGNLPGGPKPARAGWCGSPDGLPASPRIRTAAAAHPASAGPGYGGYCGGSLEDGLSGYRLPSSCGPSRWAVGWFGVAIATLILRARGTHLTCWYVSFAHPPSCVCLSLSCALPAGAAGRRWTPRWPPPTPSSPASTARVSLR